MALPSVLYGRYLRVQKEWTPMRTFAERDRLRRRWWAWFMRQRFYQTSGS